MAFGLDFISKLDGIVAQVDLKDFAEINTLLKESLEFVLTVVIKARLFKKPTNMSILENEIKNLHAKLQKIGGYELNLFRDILENAFNSFYWFTKHEMCADIAQAYVDMIDSAGNKILMKKKPGETEWFKSVKALLKEMVSMVKMEFKFGLDFNPKGKDNFSDILVKDAFGDSKSKNSSFFELTSGGMTAKTEKSSKCLFSFENLKTGNIAIPNCDVTCNCTLGLKIDNSCDVVFNLGECKLVELEISNSSNLKFKIGGKVHEY